MSLHSFRSIPLALAVLLLLSLSECVPAKHTYEKRESLTDSLFLLIYESRLAFSLKSVLMQYHVTISAYAIQLDTFQLTYRISLLDCRITMLYIKYAMHEL